MTERAGNFLLELDDFTHELTALGPSLQHEGGDYFNHSRVKTAITATLDLLPILTRELLEHIRRRGIVPMFYTCRVDTCNYTKYYFDSSTAKASFAFCFAVKEKNSLEQPSGSWRPEKEEIIHTVNYARKMPGVAPFSHLLLDPEFNKGEVFNRFIELCEPKKEKVKMPNNLDGRPSVSLDVLREICPQIPRTVSLFDDSPLSRLSAAQAVVAAYREILTLQKFSRFQIDTTMEQLTLLGLSSMTQFLIENMNRCKLGTTDELVEAARRQSQKTS